MKLQHVVPALALAFAPALAAACSDDASGGESIGPAGGTLTSGSATITIPTGALERPTALTVRSFTPAAGDDIAEAIELGPEGTQFAAPVVIAFHFDAAALPHPETPGVATVLTYTDGAWVELDSVVDTATSTVRATTTHFSRFGWAQRCHNGEQPGCCYPRCGDDQVLSCLGANICGYPCTCVAAPRWFLTCGDPSCHGHDDTSTVPKCTTETAGAACDGVGVECDPVNDCNALLRCATSDPREQPGGCPISVARVKQDLRYLDAAALDRYRDEVLRTKLATWRYRFDPTRERLGFIIDDDPASMAVDAGRQMVDLYGYTSLAIAAIQSQAKQIDALRLELEELRLRCDP